MLFVPGKNILENCLSFMDQEPNYYPSSSPNTNSTDSDEEDDEELDQAETKWIHDLYRAMEKNEKRILKRKRKGRQGRSRENRLRAQNSKKENRQLQVEWVTKCPQCDGMEYIEDHRTGDVICAECGRVESEKGLGLSTTLNPRVMVKSKPYQKLVHFRQRMAQLLGKDPKIRSVLWNQIEKEILDSMTLEEIEYMGKKKFSEVLKRLNLPQTKRLSANWIQARRRLGCTEVPSEVSDLPLLYKRLCARYQCVASVFQETLFSPQGEKPKENLLERRNIMNVNYVTLQILRLESEEIWREWAKYFPQLVSKKQPNKNNLRWKIIIDICKKRYKTFSFSRTEEEIKLDWRYIEFTKEEISKYTNHFN